MDKEQVISIVRRYKEELGDTFGPIKVYLFGSYSKGYARPESDIDVAVVVPKFDGDWYTEVPKLWHCSRKVNSLIEPVLIDESHPSPLYDEVIQTGITI